MKRIAIFASGTGSNARCIHQYGTEHGAYEVVAILSNRKNAKVLDYAAEHGIEHIYFKRSQLQDPDFLLPYLEQLEVDLIVLAGFLLLIPEYLIEAYPARLINIHPALLPKYGGKGMYGIHVHTAVKEANEKESGITIHYVDQHYDEGRYIFQSKVKLSEEDTPEDIARRVLALEHHFFPRVVAGLVRKS